jgi:hypothetical protein
MKKLIILASFILTACSDVEIIESAPINLGAKSTNTEILSVISQGTKATVMYNVTVGAKYSVQVYEFGKVEPIKTLPLTAEEIVTTKVYDFTDLKDGIYDIVLTDVSGVSVKKPLVIKR